VLTIQAGGNPVEYRTNPDCLPFLMLLDMVQLTYLQMANSSNINEKEIFYKGVLFLDRLRADFLRTVGQASSLSETETPIVPESMQRWLCRLLHNIPHDPVNRKRHAETLNKAYLDVDVFKYGVPYNFTLSESFFSFKMWILDFLDWSLLHEKDLESCLSATSESIATASVYNAEPKKWLRILRTQFIHTGLCTSLSVTKFRETNINKSTDGEEKIDRR
jgi:hypothetical protein